MEHIVEKIADGALWTTIYMLFSRALTIEGVTTCNPHPVDPLPPKATASTLQEHWNALQEEMKGHSLSGLRPSTKSMMGHSKTNAARQYKRATRRFGLEMKLDFST